MEKAIDGSLARSKRDMLAEGRPREAFVWHQSLLEAENDNSKGRRKRACSGAKSKKLQKVEFNSTWITISSLVRQFNVDDLSYQLCLPNLTGANM